MQRYQQVLESVPGVTAWVVERERGTERQRYVIGDRPEAERTVDRTRVTITVLHRHPGGQGRASFTLFGHDAPLDRKQVEEAVFRASLQENPPYDLPAPRATTQVGLVDPELSGESVRASLDRVRERVEAVVAGERAVRVSAFELFADHAEHEILTSEGMTAGYDATALTFEIVLLARGAGGGAGAGGAADQEAESYGGYTVRRLADLELEETVRQHAQRARDSLRGELPASRQGAVVMSERAFLPLFTPLKIATSGESVYRQLSPLSVGAPVVGDRRLSGDILGVTSDATLPYGIESRPYDEDGLALGPVPVVVEGTVRAIAAATRYADYLELEPTGAWHNLVVAPGGASASDLLDAGGEPLLHIVEFSWLNPNAITGSFSTEIRLAYELGPGGVRVVKGGSLSGNAYDAFAALHLSRETELRGHYQGPTHVRFDALQITGA